MFSAVNVDCCKTPGCKNMGVINSSDYITRGNDILCRECGFLFPVISSAALNTFRYAMNHPWKGLIKQCPYCGSIGLKHYGFSAQGKRRMCCCYCSKTFIRPEQITMSPRQSLLALLIRSGAHLQEICSTLAIDKTTLKRELTHLSQLALQSECNVAFGTYDITLSSRAFYVSFNGGDNQLYALVTAEENSGKVVALSTNYSAVGINEEYEYESEYEEREPPGALSHLVQRKELITMRRRGALFDIDYGPARLYRHDRGMVVKPVLTAYRHFDLVKALTDERSLNVQHFLDHECFILGGCMVANVAHIRQGRCHIAFVRERGCSPPANTLPPRFFRGGGIRNNIWRAFSTRDYAMAVCNLTENKKTSVLRQATLRSATHFIDYVQQHPFLPVMKKMSPANVVLTLNYIKYEYNKQHVSAR